MLKTKREEVLRGLNPPLFVAPVIFWSREFVKYCINELLWPQGQPDARHCDLHAAKSPFIAPACWSNPGSLICCSELTAMGHAQSNKKTITLRDRGKGGRYREPGV